MLWMPAGCGRRRAIRSANKRSNRYGAGGRASNVVRGNSSRGERRLERALGALRRALNESGAPWMTIGGIAVIAHGVRRMTTDIDAVVQGDSVGIRSLARILAGHSIVPRIKGAVAFAEQNLVLLVRHRPTGVDLDVSFGWTAFERETLSARTEAPLGEVEVPMATVEDLVVLEASWKKEALTPARFKERPAPSTGRPSSPSNRAEGRSFPPTPRAPRARTGWACPPCAR